MHRDSSGRGQTAVVAIIAVIVATIAAVWLIYQ